MRVFASGGARDNLERRRIHDSERFVFFFKDQQGGGRGLANGDGSAEKNEKQRHST
jgi:hypothetical protein